MPDRPILFSAPMIRALLDGRKTQTRRVIKPQPYNRDGDFVNISIASAARYSKGADGRMYFQFDHPRGGPLTAYVAKINVGDRLWVRETWRPFAVELSPWDLQVAYAADGERRIIKDGEFGEKDWSFPKAAERGNVSPLFMPRWASRLTLIVEGVKVERLQDISEADAMAEGISSTFLPLATSCGTTVWHAGSWPTQVCGNSTISAYASLWDSLNAKRGHAWEQNHWVAAYTFRVIKGNIDQIEAAPHD